MSGNTDPGIEIRVQRCIATAITELNGIRAHDDQLPVYDLDLRLLGDDGVLDSLGFVNFAVELESAMQNEFGPDVSVMADLLSTPDAELIGTVRALSRFVSARAVAEG
jgi:acyl carrier protein